MTASNESHLAVVGKTRKGNQNPRPWASDQLTRIPWECDGREREKRAWRGRRGAGDGEGRRRCDEGWSGGPRELTQTASVPDTFLADRSFRKGQQNRGSVSEARGGKFAASPKFRVFYRDGLTCSLFWGTGKGHSIAFMQRRRHGCVRLGTVVSRLISWILTRMGKLYLVMRWRLPIHNLTDVPIVLDACIAEIVKLVFRIFVSYLCNADAYSALAARPVVSVGSFDKIEGFVYPLGLDSSTLCSWIEPCWNRKVEETSRHGVIGNRRSYSRSQHRNLIASHQNVINPNQRVRIIQWPGARSLWAGICWNIDFPQKELLEWGFSSNKVDAVACARGPHFVEEAEFRRPLAAYKFLGIPLAPAPLKACRKLSGPFDQLWEVWLVSGLIGVCSLWRTYSWRLGRMEWGSHSKGRWRCTSAGVRLVPLPNLWMDSKCSTALVARKCPFKRLMARGEVSCQKFRLLFRVMNSGLENC